MSVDELLSEADYSSKRVIKLESSLPMATDSGAFITEHLLDLWIRICDTKNVERVFYHCATQPS